MSVLVVGVSEVAVAEEEGEELVLVVVVPLFALLCEEEGQRYFH